MTGLRPAGAVLFPPLEPDTFTYLAGPVGEEWLNADHDGGWAVSALGPCQDSGERPCLFHDGRVTMLRDI